MKDIYLVTMEIKADSSVREFKFKVTYRITRAFYIIKPREQICPIKAVLSRKC